MAVIPLKTTKERIIMSDIVENTHWAVVFVTTEKAYNNIGKSKLQDISKLMNLCDYEDKDEFLVAANDYATNVLLDTDADRKLVFLFPRITLKTESSTANGFGTSNHDCGFISKYDINEQFWSLVSLDVEAMGLFLAWYEMEGLKDNSVPLTLLKANNRHIGFFARSSDFAKNYADNTGVLEGLPAYVADNIDFNEMGHQIVGEGLVRMHKNHYFKIG